MRWFLLVVALLAFVPPDVQASENASPTVSRLQSTLETMRQQRQAADQERGGDLSQLNEARRQAAAAEAARLAARRAARRRRSRGFPLVVFVREVGHGIFGEDGAVRGATTVARGVQNEVRNAARHVSGPVGHVFEQVDRIRNRVLEIAKRPLRPIFDRTGQVGALLEEYFDAEVGGRLDARIDRTGVGRTRRRIERGATRLNDRLEELSGMLDQVDADRQDIDSLWQFLTGIDNPRAREILRQLAEERLGVDFDEMTTEGGPAGDAARDNIRRGAAGRSPIVTPGATGPKVPMEGRGRPPSAPRVEGRGMGRMGPR